MSPLEEPRVVLKRFDDSSIVLELQFWIENPERRRVLCAQTDVIAAVKAAFDREGITIPFPQRTHRSRDEHGFRVETPGPNGGTTNGHFEAETSAEDD